MAQFKNDEKPPTMDADAGARIGLVTMKKPTYSKKEVSLKADSLTVGVELNATQSAAAREWLDLVVVADIGDWAPEQERLLKLKKALEFVMQKLTPMDRLSVVTSSGPTGGVIDDRLCPLRCMTPAAQADLKTRIAGLTNCWVNIMRSYERALEIIRGRVHTDGRAACIFFVTDDYERSGDARSLDPGNVPVHTFGFGAHAGHELLVDMAKKSLGGTYSYVPAELDLCAPFSQLLGGLLTVVAQDVQLTLTTESKDVDAMVLSPGIDYNHTSKVNDRGENEIVVSFGTIFSGESRKVLLNFKLRPTKTKGADKLDATLAEAKYSYVAQKGQENQQTSWQIIIRRTEKPTAAPSIDAAELQAEDQRQQHADSISAAMVLAGGGNLEEARRKLQDRLNFVDNIMLDDGEMMASMLHAELLQLLKFMASPELYTKQGKTYALAVVSSHARQRTAIKGVVEPAACLYITRRMITHVQQAKQFDKNPTAALPSADEDVRQEMAAFNQLATVAGPKAFDLENAIQSLQIII